MVREKQHKKQEKRTTGSRPLSTKPSHSFGQRLPKVSPLWFCFIALWIFSSFYYGDVFYMAEQNSFFAFNHTLMGFLLQQSWGPLMATGRFFLLSFACPLAGGALLAIMLTLIAWLSIYVFRMPTKVRGIAFLLAFAIPFVLVAKGINIFYMSEPSIVFIYPLVTLFVLSIAAVAIRLTTHQPIQSLLKPSIRESRSEQWLQVSAIAILTIALFSFAEFTQQNTRLTCKMQKQMQEQDWDGMIESAHCARQPNRAIAAYYAIALSQTDQLCNRLFEIHYQYPKETVKDRDGKIDTGTAVYLADGNFYAGLTFTAYHNALERTVADGPTIRNLELMTKCALLNNEWEVAKKYLLILKQTAFESSFIETYEPMIENSKLIAENQEMKNIQDVMPVNDSFELKYQSPLFLGYNIMLTSGRSDKALKASLAACLYTKLMPNFVERLQPLAGQSLPQSVEEGVVLANSIMKNNLSSQFQISPVASSIFSQFGSAVTENLKMDRKEAAKKLRDQYENYYPYYYFYENIPDKDAKKDAEKKGGVN